MTRGLSRWGAAEIIPRNVMCSPLSGVEKDEYFDVVPWAEAAGEYLLSVHFCGKNAAEAEGMLLQFAEKYSACDIP